MQNIPSVSTRKAVELVKMAAQINRSIILWGEPGVGKSAVIKAYAEELGARLVDIRLSQYDAVDMRGLPDSDGEGGTVWLRPSTMPFVGNPAFDNDDSSPIILFLDELMQAKPDLQAMGFQLLHTDDRCVGEHALLDNVIVVAASNRETDRAGVQKMLTPVANRMIHVNVDADLNAFKAWAIQSGIIDSRVLGFLDFRPDFLTQFEQAQQTSAKAFPTPRSWETVSEILATVADPELRSLAISATIGEGVGTEFAAFCRMAEEAPSYKEIVANPSKARVPEARDMLCAVSAMLTRRVTASDLDAVIEYADRMPKEYRTVLYTDLSHNRTDIVVGSEKMMDRMADLGQQIFSDD